MSGLLLRGKKLGGEGRERGIPSSTGGRRKRRKEGVFLKEKVTNRITNLGK